MAQPKATINNWYLSNQFTTKLDQIQEYTPSYPPNNEMNRKVPLRSFLPSPNKQSPNKQSNYPTLQRTQSFNPMKYQYHSSKPIYKKSHSTRDTLSLRKIASEPLFQRVQDSIGSKRSKAMDTKTSNSARQYYELIVNDNTTYDYKRQLIYNDLVIGNKNPLKMKKHFLNGSEEFELKYKIGINSQIIQRAKGSILTVGRFEENDIYTGSDDRSVSRIQFFILVIGDSLIILDGWSIGGTQTIKVNNCDSNLKHSMPNKRYVLRYNKNDRIHLKLGEDIDLIINAKECVVCMEKARVIRNKCGHYSLCQDCYHEILSSDKRECPICRAELDGSVNVNIPRLYNVQSFCPR